MSNMYPSRERKQFWKPTPMELPRGLGIRSEDTGESGTSTSMIGSSGSMSGRDDYHISYPAEALRLTRPLPKAFKATITTKKQLTQQPAQQSGKGEQSRKVKEKEPVIPKQRLPHAPHYSLPRHPKTPPQAPLSSSSPTSSTITESSGSSDEIFVPIHRREAAFRPVKNDTLIKSSPLTIKKAKMRRREEDGVPERYGETNAMGAQRSRNVKKLSPMPQTVKISGQQLLAGLLDWDTMTNKKKDSSKQAAKMMATNMKAIANTKMPNSKKRAFLDEEKTLKGVKREFASDNEDEMPKEGYKVTPGRRHAYERGISQNREKKSNRRGISIGDTAEINKIREYERVKTHNDRRLRAIYPDETQGVRIERLITEDNGNSMYDFQNTVLEQLLNPPLLKLQSSQSSSEAATQTKHSAIRKKRKKKKISNSKPPLDLNVNLPVDGITPVDTVFDINARNTDYSWNSKFSTQTSESIPAQSQNQSFDIVRTTSHRTATESLFYSDESTENVGIGLAKSSSVRVGLAPDSIVDSIQIAFVPARVIAVEVIQQTLAEWQMEEERLITLQRLQQLNKLTEESRISTTEDMKDHLQSLDALQMPQKMLAQNDFVGEPHFSNALSLPATATDNNIRISSDQLAEMNRMVVYGDAGESAATKSAIKETVDPALVIKDNEAVFKMNSNVTEVPYIVQLAHLTGLQEVNAVHSSLPALAPCEDLLVTQDLLVSAAEFEAAHPKQEGTVETLDEIANITGEISIIPPSIQSVSTSEPVHPVIEELKDLEPTSDQQEKKMDPATSFLGKAPIASNTSFSSREPTDTFIAKRLLSRLSAPSTTSSSSKEIIDPIKTKHLSKLQQSSTSSSSKENSGIAVAKNVSKLLTFTPSHTLLTGKLSASDIAEIEGMANEAVFKLGNRPLEVGLVPKDSYQDAISNLSFSPSLAFVTDDPSSVTLVSSFTDMSCKQSMTSDVPTSKEEVSKEKRRTDERKNSTDYFATDKYLSVPTIFKEHTTLKKRSAKSLMPCRKTGVASPSASLVEPSGTNLSEITNISVEKDIECIAHPVSTPTYFPVTTTFPSGGASENVLGDSVKVSSVSADATPIIKSVRPTLIDEVTKTAKHECKPERNLRHSRREVKLNRRIVSSPKGNVTVKSTVQDPTLEKSHSPFAQKNVRSEAKPTPLAHASKQMSLRAWEVSSSSQNSTSLGQNESTSKEITESSLLPPTKNNLAETSFPTMLQVTDMKQTVPSVNEDGFVEIDSVPRSATVVWHKNQAQEIKQMHDVNVERPLLESSNYLSNEKIPELSHVPQHTPAEISSTDETSEKRSHSDQFKTKDVVLERKPATLERKPSYEMTDLASQRKKIKSPAFPPHSFLKRGHDLSARKGSLFSDENPIVKSDSAVCGSNLPSAAAKLLLSKMGHSLSAVKTADSLARMEVKTSSSMTAPEGQSVSSTTVVQAQDSTASLSTLYADTPENLYAATLEKLKTLIAEKTGASTSNISIEARTPPIALRDKSDTSSETPCLPAFPTLIIKVSTSAVSKENNAVTDYPDSTTSFAPLVPSNLGGNLCLAAIACPGLEVPLIEDNSSQVSNDDMTRTNVNLNPSFAPLVPSNLGGNISLSTFTTNEESEVGSSLLSPPLSFATAPSTETVVAPSSEIATAPSTEMATAEISIAPSTEMTTAPSTKIKDNVTSSDATAKDSFFILNGAKASECYSFSGMTPTETQSDFSDSSAFRKSSFITVPSTEVSTALSGVPGYLSSTEGMACDVHTTPQEITSMSSTSAPYAFSNVDGQKVSISTLDTMADVLSIPSFAPLVPCELGGNISLSKMVTNESSKTRILMHEDSSAVRIENGKGKPIGVSCGVLKHSFKYIPEQSTPADNLRRQISSSDLPFSFKTPLSGSQFHHTEMTSSTAHKAEESSSLVGNAIDSSPLKDVTPNTTNLISYNSQSESENRKSITSSKILPLNAKKSSFAPLVPCSLGGNISITAMITGTANTPPGMAKESNFQECIKIVQSSSGEKEDIVCGRITAAIPVVAVEEVELEANNQHETSPVTDILETHTEGNTKSQHVVANVRHLKPDILTELEKNGEMKFLPTAPTHNDEFEISDSPSLEPNHSDSGEMSFPLCNDSALKYRDYECFWEENETILSEVILPQAVVPDCTSCDQENITSNAAVECTNQDKAQKFRNDMESRLRSLEVYRALAQGKGVGTFTQKLVPKSLSSKSTLSGSICVANDLEPVDVEQKTRSDACLIHDEDKSGYTDNQTLLEHPSQEYIASTQNTVTWPNENANVLHKNSLTGSEHASGMALELFDRFETLQKLLKQAYNSAEVKAWQENVPSKIGEDDVESKMFPGITNLKNVPNADICVKEEDEDVFSNPSIELLTLSTAGVIERTKSSKVCTPELNNELTELKVVHSQSCETPDISTNDKASGSDDDNASNFMPLTFEDDMNLSQQNMNVSNEDDTICILRSTPDNSFLGKSTNHDNFLLMKYDLAQELTTMEHANADEFKMDERSAVLDGTKEAVKQTSSITQNIEKNIVQQTSTNIDFLPDDLLLLCQENAIHAAAKKAWKVSDTSLPSAFTSTKPGIGRIGMFQSESQLWGMPESMQPTDNMDENEISILTQIQEADASSVMDIEAETSTESISKYITQPTGHIPGTIENCYQSKPYPEISHNEICFDKPGLQVLYDSDLCSSSESLQLKKIGESCEQSCSEFKRNVLDMVMQTPVEGDMEDKFDTIAQEQSNCKTGCQHNTEIALSLTVKCSADTVSNNSSGNSECNTDDMNLDSIPTEYTKSQALFHECDVSLLQQHLLIREALEHAVPLNSQMTYFGNATFDNAGKGEAVDEPEPEPSIETLMENYGKLTKTCCKSFKHCDLNSEGCNAFNVDKCTTNSSKSQVNCQNITNYCSTTEIETECVLFQKTAPIPMVFNLTKNGGYKHLIREDYDLESNETVEDTVGEKTGTFCHYGLDSGMRCIIDNYVQLHDEEERSSETSPQFSMESLENTLETIEEEDEKISDTSSQKSFPSEIRSPGPHSGSLEVDVSERLTGLNTTDNTKLPRALYAIEEEAQKSFETESHIIVKSVIGPENCGEQHHEETVENSLGNEDVTSGTTECLCKSKHFDRDRETPVEKPSCCGPILEPSTDLMLSESDEEIFNFDEVLQEHGTSSPVTNKTGQRQNSVSPASLPCSLCRKTDCSSAGSESESQYSTKSHPKSSYNSICKSHPPTPVFGMTAPSTEQSASETLQKQTDEQGQVHTSSDTQSYCSVKSTTKSLCGDSHEADSITSEVIPSDCELEVEYSIQKSTPPATLKKEHVTQSDVLKTTFQPDRDDDISITSELINSDAEITNFGIITVVKQPATTPTPTMGNPDLNVASESEHSVSESVAKVRRPSSVGQTSRHESPSTVIDQQKRSTIKAVSPASSEAESYNSKQSSKKSIRYITHGTVSVVSNGLISEPESETIRTLSRTPKQKGDGTPSTCSPSTVAPTDSLKKTNSPAPSEAESYRSQKSVKNIRLANLQDMSNKKSDLDAEIRKIYTSSPTTSSIGSMNCRVSPAVTPGQLIPGLRQAPSPASSEAESRASRKCGIKSVHDASSAASITSDVPSLESASASVTHEMLHTRLASAASPCKTERANSVSPKSIPVCSPVNLNMISATSHKLECSNSVSQKSVSQCSPVNSTACSSIPSVTSKEPCKLKEDHVNCISPCSDVRSFRSLAVSPPPLADHAMSHIVRASEQRHSPADEGDNARGFHPVTPKLGFHDECFNKNNPNNEALVAVKALPRVDLLTRYLASMKQNGPSARSNEGREAEAFRPYLPLPAYPGDDQDESPNGRY